VWFISIKPAPARTHIAKAREGVNAAIRDMAAVRDDLIYVDIESAMLAKYPLQDQFLADGIHLSPAGYQVWGSIIRPVLEALPASSASAGNAATLGETA
jgi:lysophospholipase L1-like esterase